MSTIKTNKITSDTTLSINSGISLSSYVRFDNDISSIGLLSVSNNTSSSSSTTGALVVSGGVGVGGSLNVASTGSFGGTLTLAGATSSAIISCGTAPTQGQHLANKTYVDSKRTISIVSAIGVTSVSLTLTPGTWFIVAFTHALVGGREVIYGVIRRTGLSDVQFIPTTYDPGTDHAGVDIIKGFGGITITVNSTETVTVVTNSAKVYAKAIRLSKG